MYVIMDVLPLSCINCAMRKIQCENCYAKRNILRLD